jgi:hypothetical protein
MTLSAGDVDTLQLPWQLVLMHTAGQSSQEADGLSAGQEIPGLLWKQTFIAVLTRAPDGKRNFPDLGVEGSTILTLERCELDADQCNEP